MRSECRGLLKLLAVLTGILSHKKLGNIEDNTVYFEVLAGVPLYLLDV